jgi:hypothetical protein
MESLTLADWIAFRPEKAGSPDKQAQGEASNWIVRHLNSDHTSALALLFSIICSADSPSPVRVSCCFPVAQCLSPSNLTRRTSDWLARKSMAPQVKVALYHLLLVDSKRYQQRPPQFNSIPLTFLLLLLA